MNNKRKQLYRIGLTGGIASGKSKLRIYLRDTYPRIYTIDLDIYGHMVYQYNPLILKNIEGIFGKDCLIHDSYGERIQINREKLG
jgi:dephospho-CoA kinase